MYLPNQCFHLGIIPVRPAGIFFFELGLGCKLASIKPWPMKKLFIRLNGVHPLPAKLLERLEKKVQKKVFNSGDFILRDGQICRYVYYIERGIVSHKSIGDKSEATTWILCENDIVTSVNSYFQQTPSDENIIAIENTIVWYDADDGDGAVE